MDSLSLRRNSCVPCGADPLVRGRRPRRPAEVLLGTRGAGPGGPARTRASAPPLVDAGRKTQKCVRYVLLLVAMQAGAFQQEVAHTFTTRDGLPSNDVISVAVVNGQVFAKTTSGIARFSGGLGAGAWAQSATDGAIGGWVLSAGAPVAGAWVVVREVETGLA